MVEKRDRVRYAVVGLGWIAQAAVLPAFRNAKENSELVGLISGDPEKRRRLGERYGISKTYSYDDYDACLKSGEVDAVYLALPNHLHCEYAVRAAKAGVHILVEKPMALTQGECMRMIDACRENNVKLMVAYRLHFEEANLKAIDLVQSGKIGDPRYFVSSFSESVDAGNYRLKKSCGGGPLWDLGIYCLNAARCLFQDEPTEVAGFSVTGRDSRFTEVEETFSALLRFPQGRTAVFTCSFGAVATDVYRLVGSEGEICLSPGYHFDNGMKLTLTIDAQIEEITFDRTDHFGPELLYFSNCILSDESPEPSGMEGLADVKIIKALYDSADLGRPVVVSGVIRPVRPSLLQRSFRPAVNAPPLVHASEPAVPKSL